MEEKKTNLRRRGPEPCYRWFWDKPATFQSSISFGDSASRMENLAIKLPTCGAIINERPTQTRPICKSNGAKRYQELAEEKIVKQPAFKTYRKNTK